MLNELPRPRVELIDQVIAPFDSVMYELWPEDPDGEDSAVTLEFEILTKLNEIMCKQCFHFDP